MRPFASAPPPRTTVPRVLNPLTLTPDGLLVIANAINFSRLNDETSQEQWSSKRLIDQQRRRIFPSDEIIPLLPVRHHFHFYVGSKAVQRLCVWSAKIGLIIMGFKLFENAHLSFHVLPIWAPPKQKIKQRDRVWHCLQRVCMPGVASRVRLGAWWHLE